MDPAAGLWGVVKFEDVDHVYATAPHGQHYILARTALLA